MKKIKAKELHITPHCTKGRGVEGAIDHALALIKTEFLATHKIRPDFTQSIELYSIYETVKKEIPQ